MIQQTTFPLPGYPQPRIFQKVPMLDPEKAHARSGFRSGHALKGVRVGFRGKLRSRT